MAPIRTARSKQSSDKTPKGGRKKSLQSKNQTGSNNTRSTTRVSKQVKGPPPKQQKTKSAPGPVKKKRKIYTEKELGIPKLNMITPAGVQLPKGKKKGKVFVDDQESMMTILAIVNASKEGQIESKMMKSRQMEEVREARRKEAEARQERKNLQLEETKNSLRRGRKRKRDVVGQRESAPSEAEDAKGVKPNPKRVSFA